MEALAPDLCITAAYGNMLPQRFLDIPKYGNALALCACSHPCRRRDRGRGAQ
jgi:methionyl-tRNA formyltransferase